jgi:isoleucyl-tRNA synthetase
MAEDYSKSVNLPKTDFPMRGNLPKREPEMLEYWEKIDLYDEIVKRNKGKKSFILHDGPPYANGDIHMGHALNKVLKDIIVRYKNMTGHYAPYVPGWDTHGLPIELQAIKKLGLNRHEAGAVKFCEACKEFALEHVENQKEQFKRLGVIGDWEHPYLTLKDDYVAKQVEIFGEMAKQGLIYKGLKPVYWCPTCETALAEAEIEYAEDKTNSIYVKFAVNDDKGLFGGLDNVYFVIWTTTTWTLPGNVAIALNPDFEYSLVKVPSGEIYVLATELVDSVAKAANIDGYEIVKRFKGRELENITCQHPFIDRESLVILGDHVTLDAGTGCVHTAPGHGVEDYIACQNYPQLEIVVPVDSRGVLNELAGEFAGLYYEKSNPKIIEKLTETGNLLAIEEIIHQYPHCWRCSDPIIFRATEQCFASVDQLKDQAIEEIKQVKWIPKWGEDRITSMVRDRSDWCISRQRIWGVPIPLFYCKECGEQIINDDTIKAVATLFREQGVNKWWELEADDILPKGTICPKCGHTHFEKETDTMDVWFDSGSSHAAVCAERGDLSYPPDLYLEGNDQYRGWFQSSLLTSVATTGKAPYNTVITHGMIQDGEGKKMSKSKGNSISPREITDQYGADILRLWVVSADYRTDMRMSKDTLKQLSEGYRKIRNTARYILSNCNDFDPNKDMVAFSDMLELDRWAMMKMNQMVEAAIASYESYEFHMLYHTIHRFCVVEMSNFYLDIVKSRLYTEKPESHARRSAQSAMYLILDAMVKLLAPVLAFTSEEIWQFMPHFDKDDTKSVMFSDMPQPKAEYQNSALEEKWQKIIEVRDDVLKALEGARNEKTIGKSLDASVTVYAKGSLYDFLKPIEAELAELFITSAAKVEQDDSVDGVVFAGEQVKVRVSAAQGEKCERCWIHSDTVGTMEGYETLCADCVEKLTK